MKILGLDLGVGSIGWALIETDTNDNLLDITGIGCRIVPLTPDETNGFTSGNGKTKCQERTVARTIRKGMDRYQMRREQLSEALKRLQILDPQHTLTNLPPLELWGLRAKAASEKVTLKELGRVLMHINQKRGYKHAKSDMGDSSKSDYVARVNQNFADILAENMTVGQHFYHKLKDSKAIGSKGGEFVSFRIKENVFPRKAYEQELDTIMQVQQAFYPDILTDAIVAELKNIIFYQRPLKSCKHLVSICEFEKREFKNREGKPVTVGPKVAPRTSPLAHTTAIWEAVNNIRLSNPHNRNKATELTGSLFDKGNQLPRQARLLQRDFLLTPEEKRTVFDFLNIHEKLTVTDLLKLLGLKKADGFKPDKAVGKGIKGNTTFVALEKALEGMPDAEKHLQFDLSLTEKVDPETGEIVQVIDPTYTQQPLYRLWHTVYSVSDKDELAKALEKIGITDPDIVERLYALDFVKPGYSNRSAKFMRRILPHLMQGHDYFESCQAIGINHSGSITTVENDSRPLLDHLENLKKNELRQPVVEKILNQMINVVNGIVEEFGPIDEIRIELARELRKTKEQRASMTSNLSKRERENKGIAEKITEMNINASRTRIQKYRLWEETGHVCMYCGQTVPASQFLEGNGAEIEHIIPRSLLFDDSFANRTCACRDCNKEKGNMTAYDFMNTKSDDEFTKYVKRVEDLFSRKIISKTKRDRLLTPGNEIPADFLNRDLTLSQYIAKKAHEILRGIARNVWSTTGSVTDFFRHAWGYDEILHDLNIDRYRLGGRVGLVQYEHNGQTHQRERITDWTKRLDHRHHAIDALTIALTRQSFIQRLNNLNSQRGNIHVELMEQTDELRKGRSLLEEWARTRPHFPVSEVTAKVSEIAISLKSGKKLTTPGKRYVIKNGRRKLVQSQILVPRGALHEQSIYGKIKLPTEKVTVKKSFEAVDRIYNSKIQSAVRARIEQHAGDLKKAVKSLNTQPLTVMSRNGTPTEITTVTLLANHYVLRYKVETLKYKDLSSIIDKAAREAIETRFAECGNDDKKYQKSFADGNCIVSPCTGMPIKTVRCLTGLKEQSVVAVRKDVSGNCIGYAKTGGNNHVEFYQNAKGKVDSLVTSTWIATKRKRLGVPVVITDPASAWDYLAELPEIDDVREVAMSMPERDSTFIMDMRMGDMFILGMTDEEYRDAIATGDKATLLKHLYRVQKLTQGDYYFRLHTETTIGKEEKKDILMKSLYRVTSTKTLFSLHPRKVKISHIGKLIM